MTIKRILLIFLIALLAIGSSGCFRPASNPAATPTTAGQLPLPGEGTDDMGMFERFATQTSQAATALAGGEQPPVVNETPAAPNETPAAPPVEEPTEGQGEQEQPPAPEPAEPTRAPVVVPTATPGLPATYTLQRGEFPYCIARRFNINPSDLLRANGLTANTTTYPGLRLTIPQNAGGFPGNRSLRSHPTTYTVRSGDTINSVACYFGDVDPNAIAIANGLEEPYRLTAGESIEIP